jgi:hypothetical protein
MWIHYSYETNIIQKEIQVVYRIILLNIQIIQS